MTDMLTHELTHEFNKALEDQELQRWRAQIDSRAAAFMEHLNRSVAQKLRYVMQDFEVLQRMDAARFSRQLDAALMPVYKNLGS